MNYCISIDPGSYKCGLVLADINKKVILDGRIVRAPSVVNLIYEWQSKYPIQLFLLGNGTNSKYWFSEINSLEIARINYVEEYGTTLRARRRYWELFPPNPFLFFIPQGILLTPKNLDSLAALILLEDHFKKKFHWTGDISFRTWP